MATELDDDTLQRFYDGDLSPLEQRTVRAMIDQDPAAQKRLAELTRLSEMFTLAAEDMGAGLDSAALFSGISADIKRQESMGFGDRMKVVTGEWVEHRRAAVISIGAAAAVAALALFAVIAPASVPTSNEHQARSMPPSREEKKVRIAEAEVAPALSPALKSQGSQIENVDFGQNTGTVFEIDNEGVTTAVVWIADDEEDMP